MTQRLRGLYLESLLRRSDRILDNLEQLNLMDISRVPSSSRSELTALVTALPFAYHLDVTDHSSPTEVIDLVFELQQILLSFMVGVRPQEADGEEAAELTG